MNTNYVNVDPDSYFWTNLDQIIINLGLNSKTTKGYIKIGLENIKNHGFSLKKVREPNKPIEFHNMCFESLDDIIEYVENVDWEVPNLMTMLHATLEKGFDLVPKYKMERTDVYERIDGERDYQDLRWDDRMDINHVHDVEKPVSEWINYMEFHINKAKTHVYYLQTDDALAEIRKVTAIGVRAMEIHGCPERKTNIK